MAFTYRNPLEIAINKLPSKQADQLLAKTTDEIEKILDVTNDLFSFSITPEEQELLQKRGMTLAPVGFKSHSHPLCKMIENHVLYIVVPSLLKEFVSVAFFSLRPSKVNKFIKMFSAFRYGEIKSRGMYNAIIDSKDKYRYGDSPFSSFRDRVLALRDDCLRCNKFPKVLFLHDELHFLSPFDIAFLFETIPELERVLATTVCPVELLFGDKCSKEPRVYSFKVSGEFFSFYPDGVASECYEQKISLSSWPFKFKSVEWANRKVRVSKLYSLFAHHVFSFDRGRATSKFNHFDKPSCLLSYEMRKLTKRFDEAVISRSTVSSLATYMACLKTANAASAVAKLRQLEKRDLFPDELNFVYSFGEHFKNFGMRDDFDVSVLQWVKDKFCQVMPDFIAKTFFEENAFHLNMRELLNNLATKGLEIETERLILDKINAFEWRFNARMFELADAIGVEIKNLNKRFDFDTRSEPFFLRNGRLIIPRDGENGENFKFNAIEFVDFSKLYFQARPFRLYRDFIKDFKKLGRPGTRRQLFIEFKKESISSERNDTEKEKLNLIPEEVPGPSKPLETEDRAGFEGSIPVDLIDLFEPEKVKLKPRKRKNSCVFETVAKFLGKKVNEVLEEIVNADVSDGLLDAIDNDTGLSHDLIEEVAVQQGVTMVCTENFEDMYVINRKYGPNGKLYCTISNNHCAISSKECFVKLLEKGGGVVATDIALDADKLFDMHKFDFCKDDIVKLAKSFNRGTTGVLAEFDKSLCSELVKISEALPGNFSGIVGKRFGFAGSGKTHKVIQWIQYTPGVKRCFISPRRNLADEVASKLKGTHCNVLTFETALKKIDLSYKEIFVDEVGLLPPGYLGLLQCAILRKSLKGFSESNFKRNLKELIEKVPTIKCFGDPLQCRYHSAEDTNLLGREHDIDKLCSVEHKYMMQGLRFGSWFQELINIPTRNDESKFSRKFFSDLSQVKSEDYSAILVPGQDDKKKVVGRIPVMTISESQGLTFEKRHLICICSNLFSVSAYGAIVALTRSKVGFDFLICGLQLKEVQRLALKSLWMFPIEGKQIPIERLVNLNPKGSYYETGIDVGNSSIQDKASNDLFIMPFINLAEEEVDPEEVDDSIETPPEWFKTHIPVFNTDPMLAEIFDRMAAKESREFQSILGLSNQFLDMEKGICKIDVLPFARQNVFPHHQASDDVTFWEGCKKRIRKSNWRREASKFEEFREQGKELLGEFLSMLPKEFEVNLKDIEMGEKSFIEKRKLKSAKMWENHAERSDIDWKLDHIFLFMKSQYCTKQEKMFTTAKAGQTLACFQHIVLFKFGPMLRAIESAFIRACGDSYYIHSGKNFFALDAFVQANAHVMDGFSIESDYTAFDSSQDHVILAFEHALLKKIGVSEGFIMDYLRLKLTLGCRLGSLAIMRFTGEFCTFLFNTFANMLFTKLKYKIDYRKDRILFAGDDMCSLGGLKRRRSERAAKLLSSFSLTAVEEVKKFPMFCGWYLSPYGILKSPKLLWARIKMMAERQLLKECVDNYLFEAIFAYKLGERLYKILKEEDFEYHYLVIRFFIKNSKLLTGLSKSLIFEIGEGIGSKWPSSMSTLFLQRQRAQTSKLMLSSPLSYIKMRLSYPHQSLIASKGLKQMSKFPQILGRICTYQTFNFLIKMRLTLFTNHQRSINTSMSESFLLPLELFFQILKEKREELLCMMAHVSTMIKVRHLLLLMSSHFQMIHVILLSGQDISFQQLMCILLTCSGSMLISTVPSMLWIENSLHLTSVLHTECAMLQDFWIQEVQIGHINQSRVVQPLNLDQRFKKCCPDQRYHYRLKTKDHLSLKEKGILEAMKSDVEEVCLQKGRQTRNQKNLGPFLQELKDLEKMSLEDVLQQARRHRVGVYLWKHHIDPQNEIVPTPPPENDFLFPQMEKRELYVICLNHYCKYLFGNIAVFGSSDKTLFPAVDFDTPPVHYEEKAPIKEGETEQEKKAREESSGSKTKVWRISLSNICPELKTFCSTSPKSSLNEATFRKICEPFADLAREFLHERWQKGLATNIYKKWPKAFEKAPWVAFDFATGLKMNRLTPDEKQVIDRMTKRLFRTEGQKGVFEAGAESNLELEG
ncbi:ORF1 [polyscias capillovirus 1]|uniref:ORF1 n=1 Tax=polyscias capillovirus 1 TaxID=2945985 RepID=A0AAE9LV47_9VIRU|nr:ORF1 [polyscias capillovirus 1]